MAENGLAVEGIKRDKVEVSRIHKKAGNMHILTYIVLGITLALAILACREAERTTVSTGYASPEEASDALRKAFAAKDWENVVACFTPESRDTMAGIMVTMAAFSALDEQKSATFDAILKKHGVGVEDESAELDPDEDTQSHGQAIQDRDGFIAEMMEIAGENLELVTGRLTNLKIDGDTATGVWLTDDKEEEPVEFREIDGRWYVHLPQEGIFPADDDSATTPLGRATGEPKYDAELLITYEIKGGSNKVRQPLVPALTSFDFWIGESNLQCRIIPIFAKHENGNDVYQVERVFPVGDPAAQSSTYTVEFSGTPVTVFEDETQTIALHARTVYGTVDENGNIVEMMVINDPELGLGRLTDLNIDGDTATGVLLTPDGEKETIEFEKVEGSWYVKGK